MNATIAWWGIAIYILFALGTAYLSKTGKQTNMDSFFLGNRKMNGLVSGLSYSATTYSAFMLVGLAGLTYQGGVGALGFESIYFAGVTLVAFFGPRYWIVGKKYGYLTPSEMLGDRYQSKVVATAISLISCVFLIPYSAVQLAGVGYLLQGITDNAIPFSAGTVIATIMAIVFTYMAGIRSVMWTDSLQAVFMLISSVIAVVLLIYGLGGFSGFFGALENQPSKMLAVPGNGYFNFLTFLGLTLPWIFFSISNPQVSQRLYMPKSMKSLRTMLLSFLIFGFIYTVVSVLWGFSAAIMFPGLENADLATPMLLSSELIPPLLGVLVMVGILAAAVSTIDSILLTLSSLFARDVYGNTKKGKSSDEKQLLIGKYVIPVIAILAFIFAELQLNLIAVLSVASSAGLLVTIPSVIGAFFWKRGTAAGSLWSVIPSSIVVLICEATGITPLGLASSIWGLSIATILYIGVSLLTEAPEKKANEFMDYINEQLREYKIGKAYKKRKKAS